MTAVTADHDVEVASRVKLLWASETPEFEPRAQLVHGLIPAGGLLLMYGEPSSGKSTLAVDQACHIASGKHWRGRAVQKGLVLHLAGEGMYGLQARLAAAIRAGTLDPGAPYAIIESSLDLVHPGDLSELLETISAAEAECGEKLALLIVDTLARCFGIDENDGAQMRLAIAACDQIRAETDATLLLIHHCGKDTGKGARGHSSLKAAVDTELLVEGRSNPRTLSVTKQRDLPTAEPMLFDLEPVVIRADLGGDALTACVVRHSDQPPPKAKRREPHGRNQQRLLAALKEHVRASGSDVIPSLDLREIAKSQGLHDRRRFGEARDGLERDGWLVPSVGGVRLAGDQL